MPIQQSASIRPIFIGDKVLISCLVPTTCDKFGNLLATITLAIAIISDYQGNLINMRIFAHIVCTGNLLDEVTRQVVVE